MQSTSGVFGTKSEDYGTYGGAINGDFNGDMKYFGIWNRTLSTAEIESLYTLDGKENLPCTGSAHWSDRRPGPYTRLRRFLHLDGSSVSTSHESPALAAPDASSVPASHESPNTASHSALYDPAHTPAQQDPLTGAQPSPLAPPD